MSVSLSEVIRAARARRASLAGESAGYLVLAAADQALAAPRAVQAADIELAEDGGIRLQNGVAASAEQAERSLRGILDELLLVASSGNPSLMRASRRASSASLSGLVRELEAALIPVNRAASRRALSRLQRETARARDEGTLAPELAAPASQAASPEPPRVVSAPTPAPVPVSVPAIVQSLEPFVLSPLPPTQVEEDTEGVEVVLDLDDESPTCALPVVAIAAALAPPELVAQHEPLAPESESEPALEQSPTVAIAMPALWAASDVDVEVEVELDFDADVAPPEPEIQDSPTRALPLVQAAPIAAAEQPEEACTRPEPVILRASQRPAASAAPAASPAPPLFAPVELRSETFERDAPPSVTFEPARSAPLVLEPELDARADVHSLTPALGSLAGELPVLSSDDFDTLSAEDTATRWAQQAHERPAHDEHGDPSLDAELDPGLSMLPTRQSDVADLVASFSVAGSESSHDLSRTVKELTGLELTPAPFAALIR